MKPSGIFTNLVNDPLRSFKILQAIVAGFCLLIPVFLRMADEDEFYPKKLTTAGLTTANVSINRFKIDSCSTIRDSTAGFRLMTRDAELSIQIGNSARIRKDNRGFRTSLSDYVYSSTSYLFGLLYCLAGSLFVYNGVVYRKRRHQLRLFSQGHWYNFIIGLSLIGVALTPDRVSLFWHTLFTIVFFAGNLLVLLFVSSRDESGISKALRIGMAYAVAFALLFFRLGDITLLDAEWFSLVMIGLHLIQVSLIAEQDHSPT